MRHQAGPATSGNRKRDSQRPGLSGWRKEVWDWSKALIVAVILVLLLRAFVFQLSTVKSYSMEPTLREHEWLFINKLILDIGELKREDVVILTDPSDNSDKKQFLVKRIIGMPGDTIEVRGGQLYMNGLLKVEPYTDVKIEGDDFAPITVDEGHYFVMGDNRHKDASRDSRSFKQVPEALIKGRADLIIWPISRWDML
jgi:signal peptidase I